MSESEVEVRSFLPVWITLLIGRLFGDRTSRPKPEMTPDVNVWSNPKGFPIANADCPTLKSDEVPMETGRNDFFVFMSKVSMTSTAISLSSSTP